MEDFNLKAKSFDTDKRAERAKAIADEIRLHIKEGDKKSAIEYGCGTGLVGFQLINDFNSILFIDSSTGMLEQVKEKLIKLGKPISDAICCDFITDAPEHLKTDYIFSSLALHHIKNTEAILSSFYNILNKAGRILIVDINTDDGSFHAKHTDFDGHNGFEQADLIDMAGRIGFINVEAKTFYYDANTVNDKIAPYSLFILDAEK